MLLRPTGELAEFREEVRSFLSAEAPADIRAKVRANGDLTGDDHRRWHGIVYRRGWAAPNWPEEWGGTGWSPLQRYIWEVERGAMDLPRLLPVGINMVGPVLLAYGTEEQKRRFLPPILSGEDIWCQGYSEPEAGSDLAALNCQAEPDGKVYRVTGVKLWTSFAHFSDWVFMLVRTATGNRKQEGISVLLVDMRSPGITVRPLTGMAGYTTFNEIHFDNVEVPIVNRIGAENEGWTIAKYLLGHERAGTAFIGESRCLLQRLRSVSHELKRGGGPLSEDPAFQSRLVRLEVRLLALEATTVRAMARLSADGEVGPEASFLKMRGTELLQDLQRLLGDSAGAYGLPHAAKAIQEGYVDEDAGGAAISFVPTYLEGRKASIFGGTNEIQRNIIARQLLK